MGRGEEEKKSLMRIEKTFVFIQQRLNAIGNGYASRSVRQKNIARVYSCTRLSDSNFQGQASPASDFISYVDKEAKAGLPPC